MSTHNISFCQGASNEYPQYKFSSRNKKKYRYFLVEKSTLSRAMQYVGTYVFSLFSIKMHLWCSLKLSHQGTSNKYPQHKFLCKN